MTLRPSVVQIFELGVEATPGTTVSPSRQLRSLTWELTPQAEIDELRASGFKHVTLTALNREWTTGSIGGEPDYNELTYLLASVVNAGTALEVADSTYDWVFTSDSDGLDTFKTYSAVYGDANTAEAVSGLIVDSFTFDVTRQDASISGSFLAGRLTAGTTVSGTAAFIDDQQRPILPGHVKVYMDDSSANLGTTKLEYDFHFAFEISGRHMPVWTLDSDNTSFKETVEGPPTIGATLQMMADGTAAGILTNLRQGDTVYVRAQATGGTTSAGTASYGLKIDAALQVISAPSMSDLDGVYVWEWGFRGVHDDDWGKAYEITLTNALADL